MLLSQLKIQFIEQLREDYPETEIESFFYLLTENFLKVSRLDLALNPGTEISDDQKSKFEEALGRLKHHEPIQYIIGKTEFFGREFLVNKNVLIPRPETEELVEWIISDHKDSNSELNILDIGTGTGCIPICLANELKNSKVSSFDISEEAIKVAKQNAAINNAEVSFKKVNILETKSLEQEYDIIVSNPPYVRNLERQEMHKNVLNHEPETALYVEDNNALIFYDKIARLASKALKENGLLYFEINQYLSEETKSLVENYGFDAELKKDIFGNFRMLKALKK